MNLPTSPEAYILPLATAIGAWGGFPDPPVVFTRLVQNPLARWGTLFVLIWQGGGGQNAQLSAATTAALYVLSQLS